MVELSLKLRLTYRQVVTLVLLVAALVSGALKFL
jgi:hypothetical protein